MLLAGKKSRIAKRPKSNPGDSYATTPRLSSPSHILESRSGYNKMAPFGFLSIIKQTPVPRRPPPRVDPIPWQQCSSSYSSRNC